MLFDLSGKRKSVVRVVYAILALLMGGSLVLFGIGSDAPGGILDAFGLGSGNGSSSSPRYEQQIEDAEEALDADPQDEEALLDLARYHYLSATESGVETDPTTGQTSIAEESRSELEASVAAWEDYLETKPQAPDSSVAANVAQAYVLLLDADGAARAQEIVAEDQDSSAAYAQLAQYLYADGKLEEGDAAGEKAVQAAASADREAVRKNMERLGEAARKFQEQIEKQQKQAGGGESGEIEDPFGSLGGGQTLPPPGAP
jgi:hypothetical protein